MHKGVRGHPWDPGRSVLLLLLFGQEGRSIALEEVQDADGFYVVGLGEDVYYAR